MKAAILDGIALGLGFGLLGVGMTLVYGLGGVLNLAFGELAILAAIVASQAIAGGVSTVLAAIIGILAATVAGALTDLTLMRPVYRQRGGNRVLLGLMLTLGLAFMLEGVLTWRYPEGALSINLAGKPVPILGVPMSVGSLWASAITLAVALLLLAFFTATTFGRAVRSVIQDEVGARLVGISPSLVRTAIFGLSGALAGLVAVTQSMTAPLTVTDGFNLTVYALIVSVVGGLGSVAGAFLAGILLGIVDTVGSYYIGGYIADILLLGAAAFTILLVPRGLLGSSLAGR
jgi:branched-chain amino acid transport system permease protein